MFARHFVTTSRDELINLSRVFARHVAQVFPVKQALTIEIGGDYASGKSLVADAMKAELFDLPEIEKAKWKRCENYDGFIKDDPATISFVNARYDVFNLIGLHALKHRNEQAGVIFVSNRPPIHLDRLITSFPLPEASVKIDVAYGPGEPRARQIGPLKYGPVRPIGKRDVLFRSLLPVPFAA